MNTFKRLVRLFVMFAICAFMVACTQPTSDAGGLKDEFDEFEVAILAPRGGEATGRSTINDDGTVAKVYAKVFNSSRVHLPAVDAASDISGVTKLIYDSGSGKWSATVKLATPASGTITFMIWAVNSSGEHLYSGDDNLVVGTNGNSITVTTGAGYSLRDMGPAGGYIFYDQGSYINGWRYLEAAREGWSGNSADPIHYIGYYRTTGAGTNQVVGTGTAIGTGETNTINLVTAMGDTAYIELSGDAKAIYAAKVCEDYTGGGYSDWFLPSKDELNQIYQNLKVLNVSNFPGNYGFYGSSSEYSSTDLWLQNFNNGIQDYWRKLEQGGVRPVRSF